MTHSSDFKRAVRSRMAKTGERYTAARAMLLAQKAGPSALVESFGGPDYAFRPGICPDTGAVRGALEASGVRWSGSGEPLSEALVTGLAGGVGFLYIVFEYKDTPPLLSVLTRFDTSADTFALGAIERLGLECERSETSSAKKAQATLDGTLDRGRIALCTVDSVVLAQTPAPQILTGQVPTLVAVVGRRDGDYVLDTGGAEPRMLSGPELAAARAAHRKSKHRLWSVAVGAGLDDIATPIEEAVRACANRYTEAPFKGFASSFGLRGMEKWVRLLTDPKDKKGWAKLFPSGDRACLGLRRAFQGIEHEMTPPRAGRGLYATFLREAQALTGHAPYGAAADAFDFAAERWAQLSSRIVSSGVGAVATGCDMLDSYAEHLDAQAGRESRDATRDGLVQSAEGCDLDAAGAAELYAALAQDMQAVLEAEREAHRALKAAATH